MRSTEELPDPMAGLHPSQVAGKLVPVFTGAELSRLEHACAGRGFAQRLDAAIIAVFKSTGIRLAELAAIRYDPDARLSWGGLPASGRRPQLSPARCMSSNCVGQVASVAAGAAPERVICAATRMAARLAGARF